MTQNHEYGERTESRLGVLAIDDDAGDAALLERQLHGMSRGRIEFTHVLNFEAAQESLIDPGIDVIFLDYQLGAITGHEVLRALRAAGELRPVIMLTGCGDESIAASLMRDGADDYLIKGAIDGGSLARSIDSARAHHVRRKMESRNRQLLEDLQIAKTMLELKNRRLAELYETAHEFVDHVSHEFRTPLTVIKEFASILRDGLAGETNDEQRRYLGIIELRVDDLSVLIDDMLDISKLESGLLGIARVDCRIESIIERIRTVLERRAEMAGCRLTIDVPVGLPTVYCDGEKIGRVVINLVINALKFCAEGCGVELSVRVCEGDSTARFSVRDQGSGIPPAALSALFQRFRQVSGQSRAGVKGFGLGLSIARELVALNLGEIDVESEVGVGSTFLFTVPLSNRRPLIERYLNRLGDLRDGCDYIGLIDVRLDGAASGEQVADMDCLVRHLVRRTDLVFRTGEAAWLVAAPSNKPDVASIVSRIAQAHDEAARIHGDPSLIRPSLTQIGCWNVHDQLDAFVEAFLSRDHIVMEPSHV